eukprot:4405806-Amphidinium_carterae.1
MGRRVLVLLRIKTARKSSDPLISIVLKLVMMILLAIINPTMHLPLWSVAFQTQRSGMEVAFLLSHIMEHDRQWRKETSPQAGPQQKAAKRTTVRDNTEFGLDSRRPKLTIPVQPSHAFHRAGRGRRIIYSTLNGAGIHYAQGDFSEAGQCGFHSQCRQEPGAECSSMFTCCASS